MECNKEEAIQAMKTAEKKLCNQDYVGAKEMALKAEKLFPQLGNIAQFLTVCEVHCSAHLMTNGLYDWYKIIQVEPLSDEILIRKQYRKLALLLHPDKNKLPGAEAAFKLVGEANNTLSDRAKRIVYDIKRRHLVRAAVSQESAHTGATHNSSNNINRTKQQKPRQQPQAQPHQGFTFWTSCPYCNANHQYYCTVLSLKVCCTYCSSKFTANALPHLNPGNMPGFMKQPQHLRRRNGVEAGQRQPPMSGSHRPPRKPNSNPNSKPTMSNSSYLNPVTDQRRCKRVGADTSETADPFPNQNSDCRSQPKFCSDVKPSRGNRDRSHGEGCAVQTSMPLKRSPCNKPDASNGTYSDVLSPAKKARVEVKGEQDSNGGTDASKTGMKASTTVEMEVKEHDKEKGKEQIEPNVSARGQTNGGAHTFRTSIPLRRSPRNKPDAKSNGTDADFLGPAVKARIEVTGKQDGNSHMGASITFTKVSTTVEMEMKEHDKEKGKEQLEPNVSSRDQTNGGAHAVHTSIPLRRSPNNKPDVKSNGTDAEFLSPAVKARVEVMGEQDGRMDASNIGSKDSTTVKKEVKEQDKEKRKEQEETNVSARDQTNGGAHAVLTSVPFRRSLHNKLDIKSNGIDENFLIPALKARIGMKGDHDDNSRMTSDIGTKASTTVEREVKEQNREKRKKQVGSSGSARNEDVASGAVDVGTYPDSSPKTTAGAPSTKRHKFSQPNPDAEKLYEYPDAEFHDFDRCRTHDNFQRGQIWALYSDLDTYPKYYGWIRKVEHVPFKVHISWLEPCTWLEVERGWLDADLPISCGSFKVTKEKLIYKNSEYFSHVVTVRERCKHYEIMPQVDEIWAIYKNWSAKWTLHDLVTCEFDIVQIKKQNKKSMEVLPMRKVPKHRSVFMPEQADGSGSSTCEIPASNYSMFSHRIPAICMTEEQGGKLRGFWELDPASVPYTFFNRDE
jgi:curved DNA-binding protein CbpA